MSKKECDSVECKEVMLLQDQLIENETKFKLLFERAPLSYQSLDADGNIIEVNEMWLTTLGYTRDEVIGKNLSEFLTPEWKIHFARRFPKFKNVGEILGHEFELLTKSGKVVLVSVQGRIGRDEVGDFKQTHCIFHDITDIRKAEEKNKRLEKELLTSQKSAAIGRFAREILHDLNNILTPIMFSIEMLQASTNKDDPANKWINTMIKGTDRAKELLDQIHSFSKPVNKETFSFIYLQPIIEEALDLIKVPSNIKLIKEIESFDECLHGTQLKIHQIVMNLATNAIHAIKSNPNGGTVTVKLKKIDKEDNDLYIPTSPQGSFCCLTIIDDGCGMNQETLDRIFEPYFTTKPEGTGLGMAVVNTIIKSLDGFICVDSEENVGTKIRVYLPLHIISIHL